ncbi:Ribosome production factor 1 [Ceratocystis lukuohia]|uniref:Ribosome production factor 1 n=1 Tax=Ceratocystis lukuohia TaxID=2019550 RepID=A0ABR4MDN7_9PEZI
MAPTSSRPRGSFSSISISKGANRLKRQALFIEHKRKVTKERHEARHRRRKEESRDPLLKAERLATNKPQTIEDKRVWDTAEDIENAPLGAAVDVKRAQRAQQKREAAEAIDEDLSEKEDSDSESDRDSMLDSEDEEEMEERKRLKEKKQKLKMAQKVAADAAEENPDDEPASIHFQMTTDSLAKKFPTLFDNSPRPAPKILVTTSLNSTLHDEARLLCELFPNSEYIRRTAHRYGYKYSLREIAKFAHNRDYNAVVMLREDQKKPTGLTVTFLPSGPTATFSISSWLLGKYIPGHGNATGHIPELIFNGFRTPLGILTARMLGNLFPKQPELVGRTVMTFHSQRDFIFVRRHRYVFRDRRETEKKIAGADGKELKGVEDIRSGLQELGPRFTLKLRRIDKGIGKAGSEGEDATQWEWKAGMEKDRKRFNL